MQAIINSVGNDSLSDRGALARIDVDVDDLAVPFVQLFGISVAPAVLNL